jgi:hypothetical protein
VLAHCSRLQEEVQANAEQVFKAAALIKDQGLDINEAKNYEPPILRMYSL